MRSKSRTRSRGNKLWTSWNSNYSYDLVTRRRIVKSYVTSRESRLAATADSTMAMTMSVHTSRVTHSARSRRSAEDIRTRVKLKRILDTSHLASARYKRDNWTSSARTKSHIARATEYIHAVCTSDDRYSYLKVEL